VLDAVTLADYTQKSLVATLRLTRILRSQQLNHMTDGLVYSSCLFVTPSLSTLCQPVNPPTTKFNF